MTKSARKNRRLKSTGWGPKAKALRFGDYLGVICFRRGDWWHVDMTGALVGPINRREAYLTAVSYMNAAEIAGFGAADLRDELHADYAQQSVTSTASHSPRPGDQAD